MSLPVSIVATGLNVRQKTSSSRIVAIDAARGLIMLFSCLAHFAWWIHPIYPEASSTLSTIGMVATPTFLLISGAMAGMLCATAGRRNDLKSALFNRGLFLLTVGHFLIALAESHESGGLIRTLKGASVVDDIGLCTLLAAFLVPYLSDTRSCTRLACLGAVIFALSWCAYLLWQPGSEALLTMKHMLIGGNFQGDNLTVYTAPSLQYMAIYAMGLPLGNFLARSAASENDSTAVGRRLLTIGAALMLVGLALRVGRAFVEADSSAFMREIVATLTTSQKTPPSPVYLLFYAGVGLGLTGLLFQLSIAKAGLARDRVIPWFATIGQASLFVFILQYFLYWTLPDLLGIRPTPACALVFIGNVVLVRYAAILWLRIKGNRWMTFGIRLGAAR